MSLSFQSMSSIHYQTDKLYQNKRIQNYIISPVDVGSMHVNTKNISREPIGYNTKIDTEGIAGAR